MRRGVDVVESERTGDALYLGARGRGDRYFRRGRRDRQSGWGRSTCVHGDREGRVLVRFHRGRRRRVSVVFGDNVRREQLDQCSASNGLGPNGRRPWFRLGLRFDLDRAGSTSSALLRSSSMTHGTPVQIPSCRVRVARLENDLALHLPHVNGLIPSCTRRWRLRDDESLKLRVHSEH